MGRCQSLRSTKKQKLLSLGPAILAQKNSGNCAGPAPHLIQRVVSLICFMSHSCPSLLVNFGDFHPALVMVRPVFHHTCSQLAKRFILRTEATPPEFSLGRRSGYCNGGLRACRPKVVVLSFSEQRACVSTRPNRGGSANRVPPPANLGFSTPPGHYIYLPKNRTTFQAEFGDTSR